MIGVLTMNVIPMSLHNKRTRMEDFRHRVRDFHGHGAELVRLAISEQSIDMRKITVERM